MRAIQFRGNVYSRSRTAWINQGQPGRYLHCPTRLASSLPQSEYLQDESPPPDVSKMTNEELKEQLRLILCDPEPEPGELPQYTGESVEELARRFAKDPFIEIGEGPNGFPFVLLKHDSGAAAVVDLHGGTILSWTDADQLEMLFVHPDNDFDARNPIRGGINLHFPQHANGLPGLNHRDVLPTNGFIGSQHFTLLATHCIDIDIEQDSNPGCTLHLASNEETEAVFPHEWEMVYQINLMDAEEPTEEKDPNRKTSHEVIEDIDKMQEAPDAAAEEEPKKKTKGRGRGKKKPAAKPDPTSYEEAVQQLEEEADSQGYEEGPRPAQLQICISIGNTGDTEFQFQAASVADFAVKDMNTHHDSVRLVGLGGRHAIDLKDSRKAEIIFNDMPFTHPIPRPGEMLNWVFVNTDQGDVYFCPGNRQYYSWQWRQGFSDTIVGHPGVYADWTTCMATVGAGKVGVPVVLKPGETWHAEFAFRKHYHYWPMLQFETYGMPDPDFRGLEDERQ